MSRAVTIALMVVISAIICILAYSMVQEFQARAAMANLWQDLGESEGDSFDSARKICEDDLDRAIPNLIKAVSDSDATRRENAVKMLGVFAADLQDSRQAATDAVAQRLDDAEPAVRVEACLALAARFRCFSYAGKLEALAGADPRIDVRLAALEGIGRGAGPQEVAFLADQIKNGKDGHDGRILRIGASRALGLTGRGDALLVLLAQLKNKDGLAVQREQLLAISSLAGDLADQPGSDNKEKVIAALDEYFEREGPDTLMLQAKDDAAAGLTSAPEDLFAAMLAAYHDWGGGKIDAVFEKMKAAPPDAKKFYENVIHNYIVYLMTARQVAGGAKVAVVIGPSDADTASLLDICGKLVDLLGAGGGDFAQGNLQLITGLNIGGDVVKWREQYGKWASGAEKFQVEPLIKDEG